MCCTQGGRSGWEAEARAGDLQEELPQPTAALSVLTAACVEEPGLQEHCKELRALGEAHPVIKEK